MHDFEVFWTEDPTRVFNDAELKKYKAVIFLSTTGDALNDEQQAAFERYIKAGGGFVGMMGFGASAPASSEPTGGDSWAMAGEAAINSATESLPNILDPFG